MTVAAAARPGTVDAASVIRSARAYDLLAQGQREAALAEAEAVLAEAPGFVNALLLRGAALKALGRLAEAVPAFEAGLAREPGRVAAIVSLANAHAELGRLRAAERWLRRALELAPQSKAAHASLVSVCALQRRDDATEAACRAALAVDPAGVNAHQNLAAVLSRRGQEAEAEAHRQAAYRRQDLFIEPALRPAPTALVLLTVHDGNIPIRYLLGRDRYTVLKWMVEYAAPGQAARLPPYDFVLNAIGEPELPAATHAAVEGFRAVCSARFLNRPDRVARTSRTALPSLLGDIPDVLVPPAARWHAGEPPPIPAPALVRPVGAHGGTGLVHAATFDRFADAVCGHATCDVTAFVDFASPDGLFRKYRMMFIDRQPLPYHLAIGDAWLVHYMTANMESHSERLAEERRFLEDPAAALGPRAMAALAAIGARLDLDYAGIDFSLLQDGRVLVFEANATMVVHPETPGGVLAHKNRAVAAIFAAFDAMVSQRGECG
jgi:tetratricopeptide (TPR) repeat protein